MSLVVMLMIGIPHVNPLKKAYCLISILNVIQTFDMAASCFALGTFSLKHRLESEGKL